MDLAHLEVTFLNKNMRILGTFPTAYSLEKTRGIETLRQWARIFHSGAGKINCKVPKEPGAQVFGETSKARCGWTTDEQWMNTMWTAHEQHVNSGWTVWNISNDMTRAWKEHEQHLNIEWTPCEQWMNSGWTPRVNTMWTLHQHQVNTTKKFRQKWVWVATREGKKFLP